MIELLVNNCEKYCIILCETAGDCHVTAQHWEIVMSPLSTGRLSCHRSALGDCHVTVQHCPICFPLHYNIHKHK